MGVTIKDVAKLAGTSTATVSKVLNGSYSISEDTKKRIHKAMEELNYHPNQRARNFARQNCNTVALVTTMGKDASFQNPHMFEMMCGMEEILSKKGYSFIVKGLTAEESTEYVKNAFETKMADGFIIHASVITPKLNELITKLEIPHLVIGMPSFDNNFCWIDVDNTQAGRAAAKYLISQGYRSFGFLGGPKSDIISVHRMEGVVEALKEFKHPLSKEYIRLGKSDTKTSYEMTMSLLKEEKRPQAIICANNYLAYGCVKALKENGIKIPKDIAVIAFDDFPFSKVLEPRLSVVSIDVFEIGREAGKLILQKIKTPNLHFQSYVTFPVIIAREST